MAAVEIIMAIYESARMHEVVTMPVRTQVSPLDVMIDEGGAAGGASGSVRYPGVPVARGGDASGGGRQGRVISG